MCGRYANHVQDMGIWTDILSDWPLDVRTGYNIAPTQTIPIMTAKGTMAARWGMIPSWASEITNKYATFNAKAETIAQKPTFRNAFKRAQTCLIPALGYYEWKSIAGKKIPYYISTPQGEPLMMAGLWEYWEAQDLHSCTIITQPSSGQLNQLHHRMPACCDKQHALEWLHEGTSKFDKLLAQQHSENLNYYPVSTRVNNAANQGAELIEVI